MPARPAEACADGGQACAPPLLSAIARGDRAALAGVHAVVIAAHPDDETIGVGGHLALFGRTTVIHVTDGAPRNGRDAAAYGFDGWAGYARARRREAEAAMGMAGIPPDRIRVLGIPDQEASFRLVPIARALARLLATLRPDAVITHAYEGGHPDHDATAFAVHAACRACQGVAAVTLLEMPGYRDGGGAMALGLFLPNGGFVAAIRLSASQRMSKRRMLSCYETQRAVLAPFPVGTERFRAAPFYDFGRPPHEGTLWYERFDRGVTGPRWRALAAAAMRDLGPEGLRCA